MNRILNQLIAQRDALEIEADAIASELRSPGPNGEPATGIKTPLVDVEGYPRGDIDIYNARLKRNRLGAINYDHKILMKRIEEELHKSHAELAIAIPSTVPVTLPPVVASTSLIVMAKIDEILDDSPAKLAGLQNGDFLLKFGTVDSSVPDFLNAIPNVVRSSINSEIQLIIKRRDTPDPVQILLIPRSWGGRGLLGCHLSPI
jgi:26S proteasome non-ATPase regulatory subunit 9